MKTNLIQFLPSRSSQSSGRDLRLPGAIGERGPAAGSVPLQSSEKGLRAPGRRGFTEQKALDPGLERPGGIRCSYRLEGRAGDGRTDRRWREGERGTHQGPRLSPSSETRGERAARRASHALWSGLEPSRRRFGSAVFMPPPGFGWPSGAWQTAPVAGAAGLRPPQHRSEELADFLPPSRRGRGGAGQA